MKPAATINGRTAAVLGPKSRYASLLMHGVAGTLVGNNKVSTKRAVAPVRPLRQKGIRFALKAGRPPRRRALLVPPLAVDTMIAGFNGGAFVRLALSIVPVKTPSRTAAETDLLDHGLDVWVYSDDWLIRDKHAPHAAREARTVKPTVTNDFARGFGRPAKVAGLLGQEGRHLRPHGGA